jgi:exosortase
LAHLEEISAMTASRRRWQPTTILNWIVAIGFAALFAPSFVYFWNEWNRSHSPFGYGYLVPPTILYLLWCKRKRIREQPIERAKWPGLVVIVFSVFLLYLGIQTGINLILSVAFYLLLLAIPYYLWGGAIFKTIWGPLAYTATMIPWPDQITAIFLVPSQELSAKAARLTLSLLGHGGYQDGTVIYLPNYMFEVAKACSGLTILFPVMAIAILNTMMIQASATRKAIVIASAIPISLLANTIRIALIGLIGDGGGAALADRLHDSSGLMGVIIAIVFLTLVQWATKCMTYYSDYMPSFGQSETEESTKDDSNTPEKKS